MGLKNNLNFFFPSQSNKDRECKMLVEGRSAHQTGSAGVAGSGEGRILPAWVSQ